MQLLVSVSSAVEAAAAVAGGADVIDAKDPRAGPLGPVRRETFAAIVRAVRGARPVTAALGDAVEADVLERSARAFAAAGAAFVKVGFAGVGADARVRALLEAALQGAAAGTDAPPGTSPCGVIAVAYADAAHAGSPPVEEMLAVAVHAGARGLLVDTFDKHGPGLRALLAPDALRRCVLAAHQAGLVAAFAGRLTAGDLPVLRDMGVDIAGVRGAACGGHRTGRVEASLVGRLRLQCGPTAHPALRLQAGVARTEPKSHRV